VSSLDSNNLILEINGESAMIELGARLSSIINDLGSPMLIMLSGDLGAGKTTISRGLIQGLGYNRPVKSPTYTLVESYELAIGRVLHVDLYRLVDPQELEHLGFADYLEASQLCLIEWPENGLGYLPEPELMIKIKLSEVGRYVTLASSALSGKALIEELGSEKSFA